MPNPIEEPKVLEYGQEALDHLDAVKPRERAVRDVYQKPQDFDDIEAHKAFVDREDVRLDGAPVVRWYRSVVGEGARVLATYRDLETSPAIIEASVGQGKVVVVTTTASEKWTISERKSPR